METLPEPESVSREDRFVALAGLVAAPLYRYAVRRIDAESAHDVVADVMLVLWRRLDDLPLDDPLPWCYAVARRCLANTQRSRRRQLRLVTRIAQNQERPSSPPTLADTDLDAALSRLSDAERELVRLWAWEGLTPAEIALVLGITSNAASIRLHRTRKKLAVLMAKPEDRRKSRSPDGQEQVNERRPG